MRIKQINPRGWYDIPGYDGKYQINYFGNVRRALKRGYKALHPYIKTTNGRRVVKLNCKEQVVMKLMQITFIGELPPGMVTYHKNGIITDDALNNIGIITRSELGRLTGRGNGCETSVVKIGEEGQIVDFYRSVREAGRKNHMSYQTILDRINGKVKSSIADLATAYRCTGGTPEGSENPITLDGYKYDDGDFHVSGNYVMSRKALEKWSRYQIKTEKKENDVGHIVKTFSYDTTSKSELCNRAVSSLKKICDEAVTYEVELLYLPDGVKVWKSLPVVETH